MLLDYVFQILLLLLLLPITVYLCVKLGTIAYLRGRKRFQDNEEDNDN